MSFIPAMANTAEIFTFRRDKQDYVMVRFFFSMPPIRHMGKAVPLTPESLLSGSLPVATIILSRADYKAVMRTFTGFLVQQEHGALGPLPKTEGEKDDTADEVTP